ncbi:unnamed protein product [Closterium sp. Naga37s-1]|nr:unnamed protein product [Closterium sp. Naga37s-1]
MSSASLLSSDMESRTIHDLTDDLLVKIFSRSLEQPASHESPLDSFTTEPIVTPVPAPPPAADAAHNLLIAAVFRRWRGLAKSRVTTLSVKEGLVVSREDLSAAVSCFPNLTHLHLSGNSVESLDNSFLAHLASAGAYHVVDISGLSQLRVLKLNRDGVRCGTAVGGRLSCLQQLEQLEMRLGDDGNPKLCKFCGKKFEGGTNRCAIHLVTWKGQEKRAVALCKDAPTAVRDEVRGMYETKAEHQDLKRGAAAAAIHSALDAVSGNPEKKSKITDFFGNEATCAKEDADNALCLLFAALKLPERIADDPVFCYAVQCIARAGPGYVPPKRRYIGGAGLKKVRQKMEVALAPVAASWKRDGVTVSSDMMTDRCGRPQANVLLVNDSGAVFEQAVDCNMESKTGGYIASLLRPVIDKVGPENVVAVCTDGGSNYASAAKKIASTWPHIEHVPCATHVLDLMMEDMGKMGWAKGLVEKGGEMITFVRNHHFTRAYMKKVGGKQVLKPAGTRFGTQYIAMARLCEVRSGLAAMVLSDEWKVWAAADKDRKTAAEKFRAAVMDEEWWGVAEFFTSLMAVPFKAMRATDSSAKGMMGKLYDIMLQLTEDINDKLDASSDFLTRTERADITKIVKDRWDNSLACPMHVVGRILNPANQEEGIFRNDVECTRVFKDYIERHYDNKTFKRGKDGAPRRASLVLQEALLAYINMEGSFGKPGAISAREAMKKGEMTMVQWWSWHSTEYPELAALACRVLTQPVSASPCERGWAQWEGVHTARRNRLGSAKCADLVYIAHNFNVVRNWYKKDGGNTVVPGNIPDAPIPPGYNMDEEEDDMLGEEGEDAVLADEYGESVVVDKPRKEIGCGEAS